MVALGDRGAGVREQWQQGPQGRLGPDFQDHGQSKRLGLGIHLGSVLPRPLGVPLRAGLQG